MEQPLTREQFSPCFRRREGTEIFDGRKPDVIHYIESPNILYKKENYAYLIDERSPDTKIVREGKKNVPDVIVGYIGKL